MPSGSSTEAEIRARLAARIRAVPDFPEPGVLFRDVTPLLADPAALGDAVKAMAAPFRAGAVDAVAAIESRGFWFGAPAALDLGVPLVTLRKPGKLPLVAHRESFCLEYGEDALELSEGVVARGQRVLVVDDVVATGGTAGAAFRLLRRAGATPAGFAFLIALGNLGGVDRLRPLGVPVHAVLSF